MAQNKYTIFTDVPSGNEILVVSSFVAYPKFFGAIYHPQKSDLPVPWSQNCHHCLGGRQVSLSLALKRLVQLFCSQQIDSTGRTVFTVPSNGDPYFVETKEERHGNLVRASWDKEFTKCYETKIENGRVVHSGNKRDFQSPILMRSIQTLLRPRKIDRVSALKILNSLVIDQRTNGIPVGNYHPCRKINWMETLISE